MPMTVDAREAFLAQPHRIATIALTRPDRAPLAVPVWYGYEPGGDVRVWIDRGTLKERLLRSSGRLTVSVHTDQLPYRYVTVEGPVTWNEAPTPEDGLSIAARYFEPTLAERYVRQALGPTSVIIHVRPEHWLSADLTEDLRQFELASATSGRAE
jgi:PPOX class probable F420-dependent enzyme